MKTIITYYKASHVQTVITQFHAYL